jgi:hypothetical protein
MNQLNTNSIQISDDEGIHVFIKSENRPIKDNVAVSEHFHTFSYNIFCKDDNLSTDLFYISIIILYNDFDALNPYYLKDMDNKLD